MRVVPVSILVLVVSILNSVGLAQADKGVASSVKPEATAATGAFDRLRNEGNDALYNMDYKTARDRFQEMTRLAPDHPAGFIYLANNLWLEQLNSSRRLTTSVYTGGSFYQQTAEQDKSDVKRERDFNELVRQALAKAEARLKANPQDVEALYYQASAHGLKAGYSVTVKRSFRRAIGDANTSVKFQRRVVKLDPNYVDAYLSIGLYNYVVDSLPWFWRALARIAGIKGSKKEGIQQLEMVAERGKYAADDARVILIGLYGREGQHDRALEVISYLANKYPRNYLFGVERAAMLYRMGRTQEGDRAYGELLKDDLVAQSAADLIHYQWGEAYLSVRAHAEALDRFNKVVEWQKSEAGLVTLAHLRAGQALDALGKRDQAKAKYQIVLKRENVFDSHKLATEYDKKPYVPAKG
jgi:tetratricopeptide (TPR) repeat protein